MTEIVDAINGAFQALFYGEGKWLGILLLSSLCIGLTLKWKYVGILVVPMTLFIGIDYVSKDMGFPAVIMFFESIFVLLYMIKELK